MSLIEKLAIQFTKFPGIGSRQARRFVYFLLSAEPSFVSELLRNIETARREARACSLCYRLFENGGAGTVCSLCSDSNRDTTTLLVVEKDADLEAILRGGVYGGSFFVLNGRFLLNGSPGEPLRLEALQKRVKTLAAHNGLREVIFALSANPEGDYTASELKKALLFVSREHGVALSTLGRGLSTGTEIEYSDEDTLKNALQNRG